MTGPVSRRAFFSGTAGAWLGGATGLLAPTRPARAAIEPAAATAAMLGTDGRRQAQATVVAPWGPPEQRLMAAALGTQTSDGDELMVALLREGEGGAVSVAAGPAGMEPIKIDPFWSLLIEIEQQHALARWPVVAVKMHNSYLSTGRSSWTEALHVFLHRDGRLLPILACLTGAGHSQEVYGRRQHQRLSWTRRYTLEASGTGRGNGLPDLRIRDAGSRGVVSVHRWRGDEYAPPRFERFGPIQG